MRVFSIVHRFGVAWLTRTMLLILVCIYLSSAILVANAQTKKEQLTLKIRYHAPDASSVFLVWGLDDWVPLPEGQRPLGTVIQDKLMHTPMKRETDAFAVTVVVPREARLHWLFHITGTKSGGLVSLWDNKDPDQLAHTLATHNGVVEFAINSDLQKQLLALDPVVHQIRYRIANAQSVFLVWDVNGGDVLPETARSKATFVQQGRMFTSMRRNGDMFVTELALPANTTVNYTFHITNVGPQIPADIWDDNDNSGKPYEVIIQPDGVAEVQAAAAIQKQVASHILEVQKQESWEQAQALALFTLVVLLCMGLGYWKIIWQHNRLAKLSGPLP